MDSISSELITVLQFLLPGFIVASMYYSLTAFNKPSQFERIVEALIYTIIINIIVKIVENLFIWIGSYRPAPLQWTSTVNTIWALFLAVILGLILSYLSNNDILHNILRNMGITPKTPYSSEWYSAFKNHKKYIIVHLKDGTRVSGWPDEWSDEPNKGHILLENVSWETETGTINLDGAKRLLIPSKEVRFVEFLKDENDENEVKND